MSAVKQVIVIRKDLKMRRGKEIAQGSHASMAWLTSRLRLVSEDGYTPRKYDIDLSEAEESWVKGIFTKITVSVDSEADLRAVHEAALAAGLQSHLIVDAGKTEFNGVPTPTAVGIGPDITEKLDPVTRHLRLY